ncbi:RNA degradosome polyphosphate kinase [Sphingomonas sabuli]|uniref:Polyphosphate kinase n=1 Tax=Sphingomonas sabuli TaxID=2764186 RepID=A0A7G9L1C9_9SPHN|nr:RNA degradosome polyphosphate kinase [Sphingomonas sabuli]QNM82428.1 RNA degradosome polyphosphate kinase [Sphingomonas sabuli]
MKKAKKRLNAPRSSTRAAKAAIKNVPPEDRYFNRELSWLAFNERVLEEARNPHYPLLERLRFLSISASNLDEFFMVRVAGLKAHQALGIENRSADGRTPAQQLAAITEAADTLATREHEVWDELRAALAQSGVCVVGDEPLDEAAEAWLYQHFRNQIFPLLTPQAIDSSHPFPFIPNRGFSLVFELRRGRAASIYELVMLPAALPRFIRIPGEDARYIALETLIRRNIDYLFPKHELLRGGAFRIIRDSDIEVEEEAEDLVRYFRTAIKRRRRGRVVRLELEPEMPEALVEIVVDGLDAANAIVSETRGLLGMADLSCIVEEDRPDLKFPAFDPRFPERVREYGGDCFAAIRAKDFLVHHPYESFEVVVEFVQQAAADPDVVAIKQTLYRAGKQSRIIRALIDAAEAGKSVTAVIELKARFEEEQNIEWASALERAGVQVVYGFIDWKTHAKVSMVVRREEKGYRTYCHFGTGNYHPVTARIYTDLSYFTADAKISRDVAKLFNYITGYLEPRNLRQLVISPHGMRTSLLALIDAEIAAARADKPCGIWAKMNSLVDPQIIDKLYEASCAGVPIDLVVRGICCLRPGVPGMSEKIYVKSIVGRFLEHARLWCFANGHELPHPEARVYISSADWMPRNFDRRIEYMLPIENPTVHAQILDQVMLANLLDNEQSWRLKADGTYDRLEPKAGHEFNLHHYFMRNVSLSGRGQALKKGRRVPKLRFQRGR